MVTFNFTLRNTFFTGANRIIFFTVRPKNMGGGGLAPRQAPPCSAALVLKSWYRGEGGAVTPLPHFQTGKRNFKVFPRTDEIWTNIS